MAQQNKARASGHPGTAHGENAGKHFSSCQWLLSEKCLGKQIAQLSYDRPWNWHSVAVTWWKDNQVQNDRFQKGFTAFFYENSCSPITQPTKKAWRDIKMASPTYKEKIGTSSSSWEQKPPARGFEPLNWWSFHGLRLKLCCTLAFLEFPTHRYKRQYP